MVGGKGDMKEKERKGGIRIGIDGKIPQDKESWRGGHVMRALRRKKFLMCSNTWSQTSSHIMKTRYK